MSIKSLPFILIYTIIKRKSIIFLYKINKPKEDTTMVQIIAGNKGKGKTKHLLDKANGAIKEANGSIVYLDKSSKHMYE